KRELLLFRELTVRCHTVAGDSDDQSARLAEGRSEIAKILTFARAARGHVLRVKVEDQLLPREILQPPLLAARGEGRKVGHFAARFDRGRQMTRSVEIRPGLACGVACLAL